MKIINRLPGLPVERALGVFSGRWKAVIVDVLLDGPQRTSELEKRIVGISQKVLIEQLRALEEHGIVSRRPSAGDSQGIEYLLTPLGESFRPLLDSLIDWGAHHAEELNEADKLLPCQAVVRDSPRAAPDANGIAKPGDKETAGSGSNGLPEGKHRPRHHS